MFRQKKFQSDNHKDKSNKRKIKKKKKKTLKKRAIKTFSLGSPCKIVGVLGSCISSLL